MQNTAQKLALLCIDPWLVPDSRYRPFNYSIRKIQAAVMADPAFSHMDVKIIESSKRDADTFIAMVEDYDPDFIGISAYIWSFPTFLKVVQELKRRRPERMIIMGGPSARAEMFMLPPYRDSYRYVDGLVLGEGEEIIRDILKLPTYTRSALATIPGLAIADENGVWTTTAERGFPVLDSLPSPFQMGLTPGGHSAHLETFRGCPLSCTFCQWGDLSNSSRVFSLEYLVRELQAFKDQKLRGATIVDAGLNLSPRAFRNLLAAEREVKYFKGGFFHAEVYPSHMTEDHLRFLQDVDAESIGIGLQSYDKEVLHRLERPFDQARFDRVVHDVASIVPDTVVEIIMGLPGDNPDSFRRTLERARKLPCGVRVFRCLVLPNALMTRSPAHYAMEYDPHTLQMNACWGWTRKDIEQLMLELNDMCLASGGEIMGTDSWKFQKPNWKPDRPSPLLHAPSIELQNPAEIPVSEPVIAAIEKAVQEVSASTWKVTSVRRQQKRIHAQITTPTSTLLLMMESAVGVTAYYRVVHDVAFSYSFSKGKADAIALSWIESIAKRAGTSVRSELVPSVSAARTTLPVLRG
jgi:radical SAM superfamily enzyme YgiQ (UPF0313 family)